MASDGKTLDQILEYATTTEKFWILQYLHDFFLMLGFNTIVSNTLVFLIGLGLLVGLVYLLNILIFKLLDLFTHKERKNLSVYDLLVEMRFFNRLLILVALVVISYASDILFSGFLPDWVRFEVIIIQSIIVIWAILLIYAALNVVEKYVRLHPRMHNTSLKGYIQLTKIILAIIGGIFIISIITDQPKSELLVGFGAMAAFTTLIFRDTILGFIASIQLSSQDMLRLGDWIEMPSKNANGMIVDINLSSVKVQNWDKSVSMLPISTMVTDSFTNWRRMEKGPGRQFSRSFFINVSSVTFTDEEDRDRLSKVSILAPYWEEVVELARQSSPADLLTNLALFRAYLEVFLRKHPEINDKEWLSVHYLTDLAINGIGIEIYAFSFQKGFLSLHTVVRGVMEHIIALSPIFGLRLYQNLSEHSGLVGK